MGVLTDEPIRDPRGTGEGGKFVALFDALDADDQEKVRGWVEAGMPVLQLWERLIPHFDIGRSTVERGLRTLKQRWEQ